QSTSHVSRCAYPSHVGAMNSAITLERPDLGTVLLRPSSGVCKIPAHATASVCSQCECRASVPPFLSVSASWGWRRRAALFVESQGWRGLRDPPIRGRRRDEVRLGFAGFTAKRAQTGRIPSRYPVRWRELLAAIVAGQSGCNRAGAGRRTVTTFSGVQADSPPPSGLIR